MIEIKDNLISLETRENILKTIRDDGFHMYYYKDSVKGDGKSFLSHVLLVRPEERDNEEDRGVRSKYFFDMVQPLVEYHKFIETKDNHKVKILRAAVNMTYNNGHDEGVWHKDHTYPHKHMIVYLNTPADKEAVTEIKDEEGNITTVEPKKWRCVIMDDYEHRAIYPKFGDRWVLVITYTDETFHDSDN
jgi:hypothetical protein